MIDLGYYDRRGKKITFLEWSALLSDVNYQRVAENHIEGKVDVRISTVWLGLDHSHGSSPQPLIFETMVFGGDKDLFQMRWSTLHGAIKGHEQFVKAIEAGENIPFEDTNVWTMFTEFMKRLQEAENEGEEWKQK